MRRGTRFFRTVAAIFALLWSAAACGDTQDGPVVPDAQVAPFVGDWIAEELVLTNAANPDVVVDLIAQGATFTLNVQPSNQYTGVLAIAGQASTEFGKVSVAGPTMTLHREFPTPGTTPGTFEFFGPDRFTLDGDSEFDFNLDGTVEAALAHFAFVRN